LTYAISEYSRSPLPRHGDRRRRGCPASPSGESELSRIGDGDDLHHAAIGESLYALADSCFTETDRTSDLGVGSTTVLLEQFDDPLRDVVQHRHLRLVAHMTILTLSDYQLQLISQNLILFPSDFVDPVLSVQHAEHPV
jgi:hypothetical protein